MAALGTALRPSATKVLLLGGGELGKELVIELQRFGVEVTVVDRYQDAPAMHVAHRSHVVDMLDASALVQVVEAEKPHLIVPEIEAIATESLEDFEGPNSHVVPSPSAVRLTMNRVGIRELAAKKLRLPTSNYCFAVTPTEYDSALSAIGFPCIVKPVMSSSGKGQSFVRDSSEAQDAWNHAHEGTRGAASSVIVEEYIEFEYEITLLTVRHIGGTSFCEPIGHEQVGGDYQESWQPQAMSPLAKERCQQMAQQVTDELGGFGLFGAEFFVKGDDVWFSEISSRPHDTGMVTLISQNISEFGLHARAILGLPIPSIELLNPSASRVILAEGKSNDLVFERVPEALEIEGTYIRLFGKPTVDGQRRVGVAIAQSSDGVGDARLKTKTVVETLKICNSLDQNQQSVRRV